MSSHIWPRSLGPADQAFGVIGRRTQYGIDPWPRRVDHYLRVNAARFLCECVHAAERCHLTVLDIDSRHGRVGEYVSPGYPGCQQVFQDKPLRERDLCIEIPRCAARSL